MRTLRRGTAELRRQLIKTPSESKTGSVKREKPQPKNEKTPSIQTSAERKASKRSISGEEGQLGASYEDMLALDFREPQKAKENKSPISTCRPTAEKTGKSDQTAARGPLQNIDNQHSTKNSNYSSTKTISTATNSKNLPDSARGKPQTESTDKACMTELTAAEIDLKFKDFSSFAEVFKVGATDADAGRTEPGAGGAGAARPAEPGDKQVERWAEIEGEVCACD